MSFLKKIDHYSFIYGMVSVVCLIGFGVFLHKPLILNTEAASEIYDFFTAFEIFLMYIEGGNEATPEMLSYFKKHVTIFRDFFVDKR